MTDKFNILVIYYSQTERTRNILDIFLEPIKSMPNVNLDIIKIEPQVPFPMPWPMVYFFSIMPETVYEVPIPLKEPEFDENRRYDLIILGCQVWFLAPSLPISSFLKHRKNKVFSDTPVIAVMTCRKMWYQTLITIENRLISLNSRLLDKVVICVKGSQSKTLYNTKENLFEQGQAVNPSKVWTYNSEELELIRRMGGELAGSLEDIRGNRRASPVFKEISTAMRNPTFLFPEKITYKSFLFWGKFIKRYSKPGTRLRAFFSALFAAFFIFKIVVGVPFFEVFYRIKKLSTEVK